MLNCLAEVLEANNEKPLVETELENVLHYLTKVFPDVFGLHDKTLIQAWKEAGFKPGYLQNYRPMPKIKGRSFGINAG